MARTIYTTTISSWSTNERVERAKVITRKLTDLILATIQLNETNKLVTYSGVLADQIPLSRAGAAYNNFQQSLHQFEIIRICTFWDKAEENAETIPTVIELVDDLAATSLLANIMRSHHADIGWSSLSKQNPDPEIQKFIDSSMRISNFEFGNQQAFKLLTGLRSTILRARNVSGSDLLKTVKTLRDRNLAHSLNETWLEQREEVGVMKYGDEKKLLAETIDIVQELHLWVNGSDFDLSGDCTDIARKRAEELWRNCSFSIPEFGKVSTD